MNMKPVISFVGYANSGKTTLICKILKQMSKTYSIVVIKHHGHLENNEIESNLKEKDTDKFLQCGAKDVFLIVGDESPTKIIEKLNIINVDLIILEGFKKLSYPKFYIKRENIEKIDYNLDNLTGIITDDVSGTGFNNIWFNIDDINSIVDFINFEFLKGE